jgi:hypothetical protein
MVEGLIVIVGMCIAVIPVIIFVNYLFTHVKRKTRFDYHLELVKDKKGTFGVVLAYAERILFAMTIISLGVLLSEFFQNQFFLNLFVVSLVLFVLAKYFDEKNEK